MKSVKVNLAMNDPHFCTVREMAKAVPMFLQFFSRLQSRLSRSGTYELGTQLCRSCNAEFYDKRCSLSNGMGHM